MPRNVKRTINEVDNDDDDNNEVDEDDLPGPKRQIEKDIRLPVLSTMDKTIDFWIFHNSSLGKNGRESDEKALSVLKERHSKSNSDYYAHLLKKRYWIGKTQSRARGLPPGIRLKFAKRFLRYWAAQEKRGLGGLPLIRLAERVVQDSNEFFTIKPPRVVDHGMRLAMQQMLVSWKELPKGLRDEHNIIHRAQAYRALFASGQNPPVPPDEQDGSLVMGVPRRVVLDYWRKTVARNSPEMFLEVLKMFYQQLVYLGEQEFSEFPVHFYAGGWRPTAPGRADALSPEDIRDLLHIIAQEPWLSLEYVIKRFAEKRGVTIPGLDMTPDTKSRKNRAGLAPADKTRVSEGVSRILKMLLGNTPIGSEAVEGDAPMPEAAVISKQLPVCWPAECLPRTVAPDGPAPLYLLLSRWLVWGDNPPLRSSFKKIVGQFQKFLNKAGFVKGLPHEIDIVRSTNARNIKDIRNFRRHYLDKTWFGLNTPELAGGGGSVSRDFVFMDETTVSLKQHFGRVWMSRQAPIVHGTKNLLRGLYNMFISVGVIRGEPFAHWIIYRPQKLDGVKLGDSNKRYFIDSAPSDVQTFLTQGMNIYNYLESKNAIVNFSRRDSRNKNEKNRLIKDLKDIFQKLLKCVMNVLSAMTVVLKEFPERFLVLKDTIDEIMSDWQVSIDKKYEEEREVSILDALVEIVGASPSDPGDDRFTRKFREEYRDFNESVISLSEQLRILKVDQYYYKGIKIENGFGPPLLFDGAEYIVNPAKTVQISALRMVRRVIIGHVGMKVVFKTRMGGSRRKIFGTIGTTLDYFFGTYHKNVTRHGSSSEQSDFPPYSLFEAIGKVYNDTKDKEDAKASKTQLDVLVDLASAHMAPNQHIKTVKRVPLFSIMKRYGGQIIRETSNTEVDVNLVYLPAYAPEFNPCERVNGLLKRHFQRTASKRFSEDFLRKLTTEFFERLVVHRPETLFNLVRGCGFKFAHDEKHIAALKSTFTISGEDDAAIAGTLKRMCNNPDASNASNMPLAVKYQRRRHVLCVDEKTGQLVKYFSPLSLNVNNMYKKRPMWTQVSKHESLFNVNLVPIHSSMGDSIALKNKLEDVENVQIRYAGYPVEGEAGIAKESRELCTGIAPNVFDGSLIGHFWDAFVECSVYGSIIHIVGIKQANSPRLADVYFFIKPPDMDNTEFIFVFRLTAAASSGRSTSPYSFDALLLKHALIFRARDNGGKIAESEALVSNYLNVSLVNRRRSEKIQNILKLNDAKNKEGSIWRFKFEDDEKTEPMENVQKCEAMNADDDGEDDDGSAKPDDKSPPQKDDKSPSQKDNESGPGRTKKSKRKFKKSPKDKPNEGTSQNSVNNVNLGLNFHDKVSPGIQYDVALGTGGEFTQPKVSGTPELLGTNFVIPISVLNPTTGPVHMSPNNDNGSGSDKVNVGNPYPLPTPQPDNASTESRKDSATGLDPNKQIMNADFSPPAEHIEEPLSTVDSVPQPEYDSDIQIYDQVPTPRTDSKSKDAQNYADLKEAQGSMEVDPILPGFDNEHSQNATSALENTNNDGLNREEELSREQNQMEIESLPSSDHVEPPQNSDEEMDDIKIHSKEKSSNSKNKKGGVIKTLQTSKSFNRANRSHREKEMHELKKRKRERQESERNEREMKRRERQERDKQEQREREQREREQRERLEREREEERERLERERLERERLERERLERERLERERLERERLERERQEQREREEERERLERERQERERLERERQERERLERERQERERQERERQERERQEREREQREKEQREREQREREQREREQREKEQREREEHEREQREREEHERQEREKAAERERQKREKEESLERERLEKQERKKQERERQEREMQKRQTMERDGDQKSNSKKDYRIVPNFTLKKSVTERAREIDEAERIRKSRRNKSQQSSKKEKTTANTLTAINNSLLQPAQNTRSIKRKRQIGEEDATLQENERRPTKKLRK